MAKRKIIRKSNKPINIFDFGGTLSNIIGLGNSLSGQMSSDNLDDGLEGMINSSVYGNSSEDPIRQFVSDISGESTKDVLKELNRKTVLSANNNDDLMSTWNQLNFQQKNLTEDKNLLRNTLISTGLGAPWLDFRNGKTKFDFGNVAASFKGASAGSSFGPWGALVGGIVGGVANLGSRLTRNRKIRKINEAIDNRNNYLLESFNNLASNIDNQNDLIAMANYSAFGGPIEVWGGYGNGAVGYELAHKNLDIKEMNTLNKSKISSLPNSFNFTGLEEMNTFAKGGKIHIKSENRGKFTKYCGGKVTSECIAKGKRSSDPSIRKRATFADNARKWHHAFGGNLSTNGADWNSGLIMIGNGGTHEENPMEGVQMGVDPQGVPNLVEEGEVVFNDYVFSNRLIADGKLLESVNLSKSYGNHSFADIAEKLSKESKERPNDPISKKGLLDTMTKLQQAQEIVRQNNQTNKTSSNNTFAYGGFPTSTGNEYADLRAYISGYLHQPFDERVITPQNYKDSDEYGLYLSDLESQRQKAPTHILEPTLGITIPALELPATISPINITTLPAKSSTTAPSSNSSSTSNKSISIDTLKPSLGINIPKTELPKTIESRDIKVPSKDKDKDKDNRLTYLRYAPVLGNALGLLQNSFSKPDYSQADAIIAAAESAGNYIPVRFTPLGNYLQYNPFDRNYYVNKLNAQAGATRRAIMNTTSPSRNAALLAADYNTQNASGDLYRQAEEYNLAQKQQVEAFNRATNQANAEMGIKAAMANQEAALNAGNTRLKGISQAMALRRAIDAERNASLNANFSNLFESLGGIGREEYIKNMIASNPSLLYSIDDSGTIKYKNKGAKGGYLTIKKK